MTSVLEDWTGGILIVLIMIESIKNDRRRLFGKIPFCGDTYFIRKLKVAINY